MDKRIFVLMIALMFIVPTVSALEFDNVKIYDPVINEVVIKNCNLWVGTCLIEGADIGKAKLNTPTNFLVPIGYQKVAEFEITSYQDYASALKNFKFYDLNAGSKAVSRTFDMKYRTYQDVDVPTYVQKCTEDAKNNSKSCDYVQEGTHKERQEVWIEKIPDFTKDESLTIGIFTDVKIGDKVEWIPNIFGVDVNEWATWTASLNVGLRAYYNFTTSASAINPTQTSFSTATGSPVLNTSSGIIGNGVFFDGVDDCYTTATNGLEKVFNLTTGAEYTINYWWNTPATANQHVFVLGKGSNGGGYDLVLRTIGSGDDGQYRQGSQFNTGTMAKTSPNKWVMFSLTVNATDVCAYVNGTQTACRGSSLYAPATANLMYVGCTNDGGFNYGTRQFMMDEMGWWNRTLSPTEIDQLYNSGAGMTFTADFSNPSMSAVVSYPANNTQYAVSTFGFGCNFTSVDQNISSVKVNVTQGTTQYYTNTVGSLTQTNYNGTWTTPTLADGSYNFSCIGYGSLGYNSTAYGSNITLKTSLPLSIIYPANNTNYTNYVYNLNWTTAEATTCGYSFDGGINNQTITCGLNATVPSATEGSFNYMVYGTDGSILTTRYSRFVVNLSRVNLVSPLQNAVSYDDPTTFVCNEYINPPASLQNISLWTNSTGVWKINQTNLNGSEVVDSVPFIINTGSSTTSSYGIRFETQSDFSELSFKRLLGVDATNCTLVNSGTTELATGKFVGEYCTITYAFVSGTTYGIRINSGGVAWENKYNNTMAGGTYPVMATNVEWISGINSVGGDDGNSWYALDSIVSNMTSRTFNLAITSPTLWSCQICDSNNHCFMANENRTVLVDTGNPLIEILSPANASTGNVNLVDVLYTASDTNLRSCWWSNSSGVVNHTLTNCGTNITGLTWDQNWNTVMVWANDTYSNSNVSIVSFYIDSIAPSIVQVTPTAEANYTTFSAPFDATTSDASGNLQTCVYNLNNGGNVSYTCNVAQTLTAVDGNNDLISYANDSFGNLNYTTVHFHAHTGSPTFALNSLNNVSTTWLPQNLTLDVTSTDPYLQTCRYSTSDDATNVIYTCNTVQNISFNTGGTKTITVYANDSFGNTNSTSYFANLYDFNITQTGDAIAVDGATKIFTLIVNSSSFAIGDASATFWYNGNYYAPTSKTVLDTNRILFSKTLLIPNGTGNSSGKNVNWLWNYSATQLTLRNSTQRNQSVFTFTVGDCQTSGYGKVILNLSLKDEETNALVNITSPNTANIEVDLDISSELDPTNVYTFHLQWLNNNSVAVCVPVELLNYSSYKVDMTIGYDSTSHVREFFYLDNGTLDNTNYFNSYTTHDISLMDLASADSTTFLFEFTDADGLQVEDAIVHTFRKYIGEGLFREVERSRQDNNGQTHLHLVEEDVIYYFMVSQYGTIIYSSDTYNAKCLSTPCEISLSASASETNWSIIDNEGGSYSVSTNKGTRIVTTTFSIDSIDLVNVSLYKMVNGVETLINTTSISATAGSLDLTVPLAYGNNSFFVAIYRDNEFIKSEWIDMTESGINYFGTMGAILGGMVVLVIMLMAVSEGAGFIIFTSLALIIVGIMKLVDLGWLALISIICAGGIIVWKLINRRGSQQ